MGSSEYMDHIQRGFFRNFLLQRRNELINEVGRTLSHMQDDSGNFPDITDRATQEEEFALELRTRDRERQLLAKVDAALKRLGENEYGYCDECGLEIGLTRLEARPVATLCIDCKRLEEIRNRNN
ncbi:MAG: RNA polymerase-binding protein DksA [Candidatus Porifericomitaceae bacterium WSBS_2022_MAG_OTU9]